MDFLSSCRRLQDCLNKKQTTAKNDHHHNTKPIIYADLIEYCGTPQKPTSGQIAPQPWCCCYRINWTVHLWYSHGCRCFVSPLVFWGKSGLTLLSLSLSLCVCVRVCVYLSGGPPWKSTAWPPEWVRGKNQWGPHTVSQNPRQHTLPLNTQQKHCRDGEELLQGRTASFGKERFCRCTLIYFIFFPPLNQNTSPLCRVAGALPPSSTRLSAWQFFVTCNGENPGLRSNCSFILTEKCHV